MTVCLSLFVVSAFSNAAVWTGRSTASYTPVGAQQNGRGHQQPPLHHPNHHCESSFGFSSSTHVLPPQSELGVAHGLELIFSCPRLKVGSKVIARPQDYL